MEKIFYSYPEFCKDSQNLANQIKDYKPDAIVAVARGGLTLGHFLSSFLNIRNLYCINSIHYNDTQKLDTFEVFNIPDLSKSKKVVIVDDIVDSGETFVKLKEVLSLKFSNCDFQFASIFYKPEALIVPQFKVKIANAWIEFFWESPQVAGNDS